MMPEKTTNQVQVSMAPLLVGVDAVAALCGVSRRTVYAWNAAGRLGPVPMKAFGRRVLWRRIDLEAWAAAGFPSRAEWLELERRKNQPHSRGNLEAIRDATHE